MQGDKEMRLCVAKAHGQNPNFVSWDCHGFELVYRVDRNALKLVIPKHHALREHLLEEVHSAAYGAHLGICKTVAALNHRVWWPRLP